MTAPKEPVRLDKGLAKSYCFGPTMGPIPTWTYPGGGVPFARKKFRAAVACAATLFFEALL